MFFGLALFASWAPAPAAVAPEASPAAIWSKLHARGGSGEKEQGCRVEIPWNYSSNDELLAKLQSKASGFDLVVPSDLVLKLLWSQDLLEKIDHAKIPNLKNLDPFFRRRTADVKEEWSVPYTWGTVGIAWRADKVKGDIDSWAVFGTDRGGGNAFLLEDARDAIAAALVFHGKSVNSIDPKDLAEAKATLLEWKDHRKGFTGEVGTTLLSGRRGSSRAQWRRRAMKAQLEVQVAVPRGRDPLGQTTRDPWRRAPSSARSSTHPAPRRRGGGARGAWATRARTRRRSSRRRSTSSAARLAPTPGNRHPPLQEEASGPTKLLHRPVGGDSGLGLSEGLRPTILFRCSTPKPPQRVGSRFRPAPRGSRFGLAGSTEVLQTGLRT